MIPPAAGNHIRFRNPRVAALVGQGVSLLPSARRREVIAQLLALYGEEQSPQLRREIRHGFLLALEGAPELLEEDEISTFLLQNIEPSDFAELPATEPERIATYYEGLYALRLESEEATEQIRDHARMLLRGALQEYEEQGRMEEILRLLQIVPRLRGISDDEVSRIRDRVYLYEMRRVRRNRRLLRGLLMLQAALIFLIFPLLFINAENGRIQAEIEQATHIDIPEELHQSYGYVDGLYWSVITAFSIGYGDITPKTWLGKTLAMLLGTMGVLTTGIIAGLILNWVTPRSFH